MKKLNNDERRNPVERGQSLVTKIWEITKRQRREVRLDLPQWAELNKFKRAISIVARHVSLEVFSDEYPEIDPEMRRSLDMLSSRQDRLTHIHQLMSLKRRDKSERR